MTRMAKGDEEVLKEVVAQLFGLAARKGCVPLAITSKNSVHASLIMIALNAVVKL